MTTDKQLAEGAQHKIVAEREMYATPSAEAVWRYTCSCGETIDTHPDVFSEAFAFHVGQRATSDAALAQAWDEGHAATDEHGPGLCECDNPYLRTSPGQQSEANDGE